MSLTLRQWLYLTLVVVLLVAGYQFRDLLQDRGDKKQLQDNNKTLVDRGAKYDALVTDNINEGAAIDRGVAKVKHQRQEAESHDQEYRDYLDRPLPAESLSLYRAAAEAVAAARDQGLDHAGAAADQKDRGTGD